MPLQPEHLSEHLFVADVVFEAGALDCGHGLIPEVRKRLNSLQSGGLLELRSSDPTIANDLGAWCRLTDNELLSVKSTNRCVSLLICKGKFDEARAVLSRRVVNLVPTPVNTLMSLPEPREAPDLIPLASAMIGSWPRPKWLLAALRRQTNLAHPDITLRAIANDATHMVVDAQLRAKLDIISLGYQGVFKSPDVFTFSLQNCILVSPDSSRAYESGNVLQKDVASKVYSECYDQTYPFIFGPIGREKSFLLDEYLFVQGLTQQPIKVSLPGPYYLIRYLWNEYSKTVYYKTRDSLASDIVRVLREECAVLLAHGAAVVQFDEPLFSRLMPAPLATDTGSHHMGDAFAVPFDKSELDFATSIIHATLKDFPTHRMAIHVCHGNHLSALGTAPMNFHHKSLEALSTVNAGLLFLDMCTGERDDINKLRSLSDYQKVGLGFVSPRTSEIESEEKLIVLARTAIEVLGFSRVLLTPACGFEPLALAPASTAKVAEGKLASLAKASTILRSEYCT